MNILLCFGTRPEAIKMAVLFHELKKEKFDVKVCVTAQHREMLDQVLDFFEIPVDFDLNLMRPNQTLNELSSRILNEIDPVLEEVNPEYVFVHGDTTTSSMVALAAFHRKIKIAHVEAGLRTYNKYAPFPEEINRQLTGKLADIHFTPTQESYNNLLGEKIPPSNIYLTGNTVIDSLLWTVKKITFDYKPSKIKQFEKNIDFSKKVILVTGHRRESFDGGFEKLCGALSKIAIREDVQIVFPVHLNPKVKDIVTESLKNIKNIHLLEPLEYPVFIWLMNKATLIISDSGGIQEEAPSLNKPVIVTRDVTERKEGVLSGFSILTGMDKGRIYNETIKILDTGFHNKNDNPFGDGNACSKIVDVLKEVINKKLF